METVSLLVIASMRNVTQQWTSLSVLLSENLKSKSFATCNSTVVLVGCCLFFFLVNNPKAVHREKAVNIK